MDTFGTELFIYAKLLYLVPGQIVISAPNPPLLVNAYFVTEDTIKISWAPPVSGFFRAFGVTYTDLMTPSNNGQHAMSYQIFEFHR